MKEYNWSDITIKQYQSIIDILDSNADDIDKFIRILSILDNNDEDYYNNMLLSEVNNEFTRLKFLNTIPKHNELKYKYTINGNVYKLTAGAKQMQAGQYIDYTNTLRDNSNNLSLLMAIVLIPNNAKNYGEGYDIFELADTLNNNMCILDVLAITNFFTEVLKVYTKITLNYSIKTLKKQLKKEKNKELREKIQESIIALQTSGLGNL